MTEKKFCAGHRKPSKNQWYLCRRCKSQIVGVCGGEITEIRPCGCRISVRESHSQQESRQYYACSCGGWANGNGFPDIAVDSALCTRQHV